MPGEHMNLRVQANGCKKKGWDIYMEFPGLATLVVVLCLFGALGLRTTWWQNP